MATPQKSASRMRMSVFSFLESVVEFPATRPEATVAVNSTTFLAATFTDMAPVQATPTPLAATIEKCDTFVYDTDGLARKVTGSLNQDTHTVVDSASPAPKRSDA